MSSTYTVNLGLRKPEHRDPETYESWDQVLNNNFDIIDVVIGARNYTEKNYILNSDSHSQSLNKLDIALEDVSDLAPTPDQKAALAGEGTPSGTNKYATKSYVRMNRKRVLHPEFEGATFTKSGSDNTGILTTDVDIVSDYKYNYYKWISDQTSLQSYDISVQWRVLETWLEWLDEALVIDICTKDTWNENANCKVDVTISKDGVAATSPKTDMASSDPELWCSERQGNEQVSFSKTDLDSLALVAGGTLNILIRMYSKDDYYVKIGAITLGYIG